MKKFHLLLVAVAIVSIPVFAGAQVSIPVITSISPTTAMAGQSFTLTVTGANFPADAQITWNGVHHATTYLNSSTLTAIIGAGSVPAAGTANVSVYVPGVTMTITPGLAVTTTTIPNGVATTAYGATLTVSGGTAPYTWSLGSGSVLPAGLTLAPSGAITGTPTTAGNYSFAAKVTDAGAHFVSYTYAVVIAAPANACVGLTICPSGCSNLMTDPSNCGQCGRGCAAGQACMNGQCANTPCSSDANCISTSYCASGYCAPKKVNGIACTANDQCASNICKSGLCSATP
ncbi:MAG TPA: IPT/TIG domain-containing protein [Terriglobia bacterium]|nr:IPT/TIG domain-containing protein [Terriglobia bacterium]